MLNGEPRPGRHSTPRRATSLTREACLKWLHLRCSVRQVNRWFAARLRTRTDGPSTTCAAPPADTRRVVLARSIQFSKNRNCSSPSHLTRFWGNLPILLTRYAFVNPLPAPFVRNRRRGIAAGGIGRAEKGGALECPADRAEPVKDTIQPPGLSTDRERFGGTHPSVLLASTRSRYGTR